MIVPTLIDAPTEAEFVSRGATLLADGIRQAIQERGTCVLGLSGGSTPRKIYTAAAGGGGMDWNKVSVFLIDERMTPEDADDSNARLIRESFTSVAGIPDERFVHPDTSLPPEECAADYARRLKALFAKHGTPDLATLGLGEDGHVASLFPPLGDAAFGPALATHTVTERFAVRDRVSVTLPTLRQTPVVLFFLKGEAKAAVWREMLASDADARRWPARHVMEFGQTTVLLMA